MHIDCKIWLHFLWKIKKGKKEKETGVILKSGEVITQRMFSLFVRLLYILGNNWACTFKPSIPYMAGVASVFHIFPLSYSFFSFPLFLSSFFSFFFSFFFESTTIWTRFSRVQLPSYGPHIYRRIRLHTVHPCTPTHAPPYLYMHPTICPFLRHLSS